MRASWNSFYGWLALGFAAGALLLSPPAAWAARAKGKTEQFARVWPLPPDPPRVAYVKNITQPGDAGVKLSGWGKIGNLITGGDKGNEALVKPFGITLDANDNVCLTDTGSAAVCYWNRASRKWKRWTEIGKVRFVLPVAMAHRADRFFVADSGLNAVIIFDAKPKVVAFVTNNIGRPSGVAVSGDTLLVADSQRHCVSRFSLAGDHLSSFGRRGAGEGEFNFPTHITTTPTGEVLVTDAMNHRVQVFDAHGKFIQTLGQAGDGPGTFSRPKGVAMDADRNLYVVDGLSDRVQIFNLKGQLLLNLGEPGSGPGQFWLPNGIAVDRKGVILIADAYNRRIQVLQYLGTQ